MKKMIFVLGLCVATMGQTFAGDPVSDAFKNCINSNVNVTEATADAPVSAKVMLAKVGVDGSDMTVLQLSCNGAAAEALFTAVGRFATSESDKIWSNGSRVLSRHFGSLDISSQCNRRIRNPDGSEANYYWCNIMLDVVGSMLKAIDLN